MKALTLAFALLLLCTGAALAETPDWMTPSQETVCDGETGAAYGLCNAYCEAMDCELANDSDPLTEPHASATACTKVRDKFTNITGNDLPCEAPPTCPTPPPGTICPCAGISGWGSLLADPTTECFDLGLAVIKGADPSIPPGIIAASCSDNPPTGGICAGITVEGVFQLNITPEEGSACMQQIRDACTPE